MAEVILSAVVQALVEKIAGYVLQQSRVMHGIDEQLETLRRKLLEIQFKLGDAEQRQINDQAVRAWLAALKDAAYDADDTLDEFNYELLRKKADDMRNRVHNFFSPHKRVLFRYKMGRKIKDTTEKIDKLLDESRSFNFATNAQPQIRNKPQTHSYIDESDVIGREEDKKRIVNLLIDHDNSQNVAVLPIVGMGGLGKTTLAKLICNDQRVKEHFKPIIWVSVPVDFDIAKLAQAIITLIACEKCDESNMELLQQKLREKIGGKRYLLVLDDVWSENQSKWEELKALLGSGSGGSAVIVTTRSERVSSIMGTLHPCRLEHLSEADAWTLFRKRAFEGRAEEPPKLLKIGEEIVKKCWGLPLAVKTVGSLMRFKTEETEWSAMMKSEIWDMKVSEDGNEILPALRLSYIHLPSHTKQCFAFCCVFPKNYEMEKQILIELWMANGLIPSEGSEELEAIGHEIFDELASRSFFQDIKQGRGGMEIAKHKSYTKISCKMHDLMHDLAQSVMKNECLSMVEDPMKGKVIPGKTRHLFIDARQRMNFGQILNDSPALRTLMLCADSAASLKLSFLRALDIYYCLLRTLPFSMRNLKHLRYLDLSATLIKRLPEATSKLFHLQTLRLSNCRFLCKLPEGMRQMSSLRHLYIDGCESLKHMPAGLGQLSHLQTLTKYVVGIDAGTGIEELANLNLGGHLELYNLTNVSDPANALKANLGSKPRLQSLVLCWDNDEWPRPFFRNIRGTALAARNAEEVLEALRPHDSLKLLTIWHYGGGHFPNWMMMGSTSLHTLIEIHLGGCTQCEHLPPLWLLPHLKILCLSRMDSVKHIICRRSITHGSGSKATVQAFPSLERLELFKMPSLEEWSENEGRALVFPQLVQLQIDECPKLIPMPVLPVLKELRMRGNRMLFGQVKSGTQSLERLILRGCEDLAQPRLEDDDQIRAFYGSLRSLEIDSCNWLFSVPESSEAPLGFWKSLTSLEYLFINRCDALVHWLEVEFQHLISLKYLEIRKSGLVQLPKCPASLRILTVSDCPNLESLEEGLRHATALESMYISACPRLTSLPTQLGHNTGLAYLALMSLRELRSLPEGLAQLTALEDLTIQCFDQLSSLPEGLEGLTALQHLEVHDCPLLTSFPDGLRDRLPRLEKLVIGRCPSLERRCKEGGEYWHLVFGIPDKRIVISLSRRSFSTILLSCHCSGQSSTT